MKRLGLKLFRQKSVQTTATASLTGSAALPSSGFAFVHNSQGASAALAEFTEALSSVLNEVDLNDDLRDGPLQAQIRKLEEAAGAYANSSSSSCTNLKNWECAPSLALAVTAAFHCAYAVYNKPPKSTGVHDAETPSPTPQTIHRQPRTDGVEFKEIDYGAASLFGTTKAMGIWEATSAEPCDDLPALIIACRGTASPLDHMVNLNSRPQDMADFLDINPPESIIDPAKRLEAHGGFFTSAKALSTSVTRQLQRANKKAAGRHIVFTGHSAGGAVASLLFLKSLLEASSLYPSLKFSCVTFGAPPTLATDITESLRKSPQLAERLGHAVAFVNEFDLIPRGDQPYMRSLIDLYRSIYGMDPLMADAIPYRAAEVRGCDLAYVLPPLEFEEQESHPGGDGQSDEKTWKLPLPEYHVIGQIVLLRNKRDHVDGQPRRVLLAQTIPQREYQKLLYCGIRTHSRSYYHDRMHLILTGDFNFRRPWKLDAKTPSSE